MAVHFEGDGLHDYAHIRRSFAGRNSPIPIGIEIRKNRLHNSDARCQFELKLDAIDLDGQPRGLKIFIEPVGPEADRTRNGQHRRHR